MASTKQTTSTQTRNSRTVTATQIATFDRLKNQLQQLYEEISTLSKKSPDGAVNKFKLSYVNEKLSEANELLGDDSKPSRQFTVFDADTMPTNSDVVMMLSQYLDAMEAWRSARIQKSGYDWCWKTGNAKEISTTKPTRYSGA